ncbi:hypothetical protein P5673_003031 [Acropora cervicornis]|uniref:Uncharacterized protein n=1 Tax=Acropora cervicornis TaxID=6130 RepID=A0AAD9R282_ACRCE|nr:hypothetical protein P5673_003031 [Acropora cervicornis]
MHEMINEFKLGRASWESIISFSKVQALGVRKLKCPCEWSLLGKVKVKSQSNPTQRLHTENKIKKELEI